MFAAFKVSSNEIGTTKAVVRHRRSTKGCYTCRRRRKKCDEARPICRRCEQDPFVRCLWDPSGDSNTAVTESHSVDTPPTPPSPAPSRRYSPILHSQPGRLQLSNLHSSQLEFLVHTFNTLHCVSWVDPKYSLISLGFQDALEQPCLMYAFAACGAAILAKVDPRWEAVSLAHHTRSIRLVSTALGSVETPTANDNTWLLASINALHIFETLRTYDSQPNTFHLTAALQLCAKEVDTGMNMTLFKHRVLGEFIFQLAIASTFHRACFPPQQPFFYVRHLLEILATGEGVHDDATDLRMWSPTAMIHNMMDWIFRLSYLRLQVPLTGWYQTEAEAIVERLERWQPLSSPSTTAQDTARLPSEVLSMAEMYRCASLIFAHKNLDPTLTSNDATVRQYVRRGVDLLGTISDSHLKDTSLAIWPIFIVGLAATTAEDRGVCERPLQYLLSTCGIGCTQGILDLLWYAWDEDISSTGCSGLDVLFRDDLLSQVIF